MIGPQMKPERNSLRILGMAQSKAKMFEYSVPEVDHINLPVDPAILFSLTIGLIGDVSTQINGGSADNNLNKTENRAALKFGAHFFYAYLQAKLETNLDSYLILLGAASFYLADMPGSSAVLLKSLETLEIEPGASGMEVFLAWLLEGDFTNLPTIPTNLFRDYILNISELLSHYFNQGTSKEDLLASLNNIHTFSYQNGTPRELLLCDIACAVARKRLDNSTWLALPRYSNIGLELWYSIIKKQTFIRELWPAQHLLGEHGIFRGASAVIQMPTSAGKTKATELIIRSAFLAERTRLAVIVAPYRALCHEISDHLKFAFSGESVGIDEFTDVIQADFELKVNSEQKQVFVVTPEKLSYVLRHEPTMANKVGIVIYDEGHHFDNGARGVTYELLVSSLKKLVPKVCQVILISAVIRNAEAIGVWLNGEHNKVVSGQNLVPTDRTVAFVSWQDYLGRLQFVNPLDPTEEQYFVPRILESQSLMCKPREKTGYVFPNKENGRDIALNLGLKLCKNGCVAVFCGTKRTASWFCEKVTDVYSRQLTIPSPATYSDPSEIEKLFVLHKQNLGDDASCTLSVKHGVFAHHGNIPRGLRLAVEYALQQGLIRFVACTSTLAQGVNLPIKYLIVSGAYQGHERIKVRDFHNLIGRAGRSGKHTEGSILFADPQIYDQRNSSDNKLWREAKLLLNPDNSEPCGSSLFDIFLPLHSDNDMYTIVKDPLDLAKLYIQQPGELISLPDQIAQQHFDKAFTKEGVANQIQHKLEIIYSIESYLMAHLEQDDKETAEKDVAKMAEDTLAFHLANPKQKQDLVELFLILTRNLVERIPSSGKRKAFSRTLKGVSDCLKIEKWVDENIVSLRNSKNIESLMISLWPILSEQIKNRNFQKATSLQTMLILANSWLKGKTYRQLLQILEDAGVKIGSGSRPRNPTIDHVIDICDSAFAFDGTLIIAAIWETIALQEDPANSAFLDELALLQKQLKYGLSTATAVSCYELGFSDRIIAQELNEIISDNELNKQSLKRQIRKKLVLVQNKIAAYPKYYSTVLEQLISARA